MSECYEVEFKFAVDDVTSLLALLERTGAEPLGIREEEDIYFAHPCRDFAQTDEALRIRRDASEVTLTYKGPKIDEISKTRKELQVALKDDSAAQTLTQLLEALGFRPVATVRKERRLFEIAWEDQPVLVAVDIVQGLGSYVELEASSDADGLEVTRGKLQRLAQALGLSHSERRSYLELLLERRGKSS